MLTANKMRTIQMLKLSGDDDVVRKKLIETAINDSRARSISVPVEYLSKNDKQHLEGVGFLIELDALLFEFLIRW